jgi:hypothetical protein
LQRRDEQARLLSVAFLSAKKRANLSGMRQVCAGVVPAKEQEAAQAGKTLMLARTDKRMKVTVQERLI